MKHKHLIGYGLLIGFFVLSSFFAVKWKREMIHYQIETAYWQGIENVNRVLDCKNRPPSAYELVKLRNTNTQNCTDVRAFIGKADPYLTDSYLDDGEELAQPQEGE